MVPRKFVAGLVPGLPVSDQPEPPPAGQTVRQSPLRHRVVRLA